MSYLSQAIKSLCPNAEFSFTNDDYSTIKWDVIDGAAPTQTEINTAIAKIKADETNQETAKASAKAALLKRLGITADEATLLLG
jgi:hypothetical protein